MFSRNLMSDSLVLLVAFSSAVVCDDLFGLRLTTTEKAKENTQYSFHYFVKDDKTGDYKTQKEIREGDSVHGSYTLADPNGDLRTVTYKASPGTGFEAKVDVQSSASPMKTTEATMTSLKSMQTEKPTTLESNVSRFPGGFEMDISSKPQSEVKTEMGMKFSLKTNAVTEPVTGSTKTVVESKVTEAQEKTTEPIQAIYDEMTTENFEGSATENSTAPAEGRDISEDPIEKEIDEAINSMPKLPELVLPDNKTHFKFHKDPEEALLDERITQIARQLAETSLRREYEERKLGHFIPISLSAIEPSPTTHVSKSFRFMRNEALSSPSGLNVVTELRVVPQYIYRQTLLPESPYRLPGVRKPAQKPERTWEQETQESITNPPEILKISKPDVNKISKVKEKIISTSYKTTERGPTPVIPIHVPTFLQFFTPYVMHTQDSYSQVKKSGPQYGTTAKKDSGKGATTDKTVYTPSNVWFSNWIGGATVLRNKDYATEPDYKKPKQEKNKHKKRRRSRGRSTRNQNYKEQQHKKKQKGIPNNRSLLGGHGRGESN